MSSQPEQLLNENPVGRRWLRAVRAFALASLLEILLFMCALTVFGISSKEADPTILSGVLLFVPVCLPYAWTYWRLRSKIGKTVKKNLALSIGFGTFALLFSLFVWLVIPNIEDVWKSDLVIGIFALSQLSLIVTAIKAYYAMRRGPRDYRILLPRLALAAFLLVLCLAAVMVPNLARDRRAGDESEALHSLRTINAAQLDYAEQHPDRGFAPSLAELGPPPGTDFIDATLTTGRESGYIFTMTVGARDLQGKIMKYSVTARPQTYNQTGIRNFFTDESKAIRYTAEDRVPTAQDSTLW